MRVILTSENAGQREQLRAQLLGAGLECEAADSVPFAGLDGRFAQAGADLVAVHVGMDMVPALALIQKSATRVSAPVLAIGPSGDPKLVIQALRGGAREYLDENALREELPAALEKLRQAGAIRFKVGRTLAVTACSPGSGVTTVASNLAFALAQNHPKQVVLTELATDVPALALVLDLQPRHTASELIRDWDRADPAMLRQGLAEHSGGVMVLAHAPETLTADPVQPPAMRHLALLLRTLYDWTVLDLGHSAHAAAVEAMQLAEAVVVVTRLDVPALRLTRRYLQELEDRGIARERIRPVANFYGQSKQVAWKDAQDALGMALAVWLPDDPASMNQALNHGQPIVQMARRAKISKRILELAQQLNGKV
ncbi:MAG TPA: cellulose synthase operon protein YhjQ/BcsQ [Gemmataceae bacterium]|jgi:pilus assembly protein CpaE